MGYRQVPAAREAFLLSHGDARNARPEVGGGSRRCSPVPWPFPPPASVSQPAAARCPRAKGVKSPEVTASPPPGGAGRFVRCFWGAPALPRHPRAAGMPLAAGVAVRGRGERQS